MSCCCLDCVMLVVVLLCEVLVCVCIFMKMSVLFCGFCMIRFILLVWVLGLVVI